MKRKAILLSLFLGLAMLVYYVYTSLGRSSPETPSTRVPPTAAVVAQAKKEKGKIVPADYSWADLSKQDLEEWAALFDHQKKPVGFAINTLVDSGQTIVAEVYAAKPGEYIFTKLTPTISLGDNGAETVSIEVDSFGITTDGALHKRVRRTTNLGAGDSHTMPYHDKEGTYFVSVQSTIEAGSKVRLNTRGGYQQRKPATSEDTKRFQQITEQLKRQKEAEQAKGQQGNP